MMLVPGVGCLLSRFSPVGFFPVTDPWAAAAGVIFLFWLQPLLAVECLSIIDPHNLILALIVCILSWQKEGNYYYCNNFCKEDYPVARLIEDFPL